MTAKTSHNLEGVVSTIALLFWSVIDVIRKGARDPKMIKELQKALQFFKENKLGIVVPVGTAMTWTKDQLCAIFSQRVDEAGFSREVSEYLCRKQIRYVGELFNVEYTFRMQKGKKGPVMLLRDEIKEKYNLSLNINPFAYGWEPPYWHEQEFLDRLSLPVISSLNPQRNGKIAQLGSRVRNIARGAAMVKKGEHYIGYCLRRPGDTISANDLTRVSVEGLRAPMYVPYDWAPPERVPDTSAQFLKFIEEGGRYRVT